MALDDPAIIIAIVVAVIVACGIVIYAMKKRGKKPEKPPEKTAIEAELSGLPFKISKSVQSNDASKAKDELRTLDLEREILGDAIRRLYEAHAEGKITEQERERLAGTYKARMMTVKDAMAKDETVVALHELEGMQEDLMKLFSERFGELSNKVDELRSKIDVKPIKEVKIAVPAPQPPTPEEEAKIIELSKDPWVHRKIMTSIAPSIFGYEHIKEAIMYLLFGGVSKSLPDVNVRGEMNALLIGDPGTAKSQLLQYVARIAPRGLYTSGRGTTAAGLTAAVVREKGGSMSLEAGALVLADKGIACIDEMDKMRPEDRVAIHEAMEQHTVSVAKGGIVATLNARTAVLAAANPSLGRYEPNRTVAENVPLPVTILSRFDLIFVLRDVPNKESDAKMSRHILEIHRRGVSPVEAPVDAELLRKYVSFAKTIKPVLSEEALKQLSDFYLAMRSASETEGSPVAITARQLESLVRVAEARARVALRKEVTAEDAGAAITIMKRSLEEVGIDLSSYKMDIDLIMTGRPKSIRDRLSIVLSTLMQMEKITGIVEKDTLVNELETKQKIPRGEVERMITQLLREGTIYEPREGCLKKT